MFYWDNIPGELTLYFIMKTPIYTLLYLNHTEFPSISSTMFTSFMSDGYLNRIT